MWNWLDAFLRPHRLIARLRRRNAYYETVIKDLRASLAQANAEIQELRGFIHTGIQKGVSNPIFTAELSALQSRVAALNYRVFELEKDNATLQMKLTGALAELEMRSPTPPSDAQASSR